MKKVQKPEVSLLRRPAKAGSQKLRNYYLISLLVIIGMFIYSGQASAELTIKTNHDHINIDFFYHGSPVSVSGISDPDTDLIIKITSPESHQSLRQKGKVGGILWMNVGTINFENAPSLYFLTSTKKPDDILSKDEMAKDIVGYEALQKHVELTPKKNEDEKTIWFNEFVRYKEHSKLYSVTSGNITFSQKNGKQEYYTLFAWPYQAVPNEYTVTVYAVKNNKVIDKAESRVLVEQTGLVKTLAGMAKNNASVYGMLSILVALGAGFVVGLIFRKGGGDH